MAVQGSIVRLQVQSASLKIGEPRQRRYDPTSLVAVPVLTVGEEGVCGRTSLGEQVGDVHHVSHPASKNRQGINGISFCFTTHYRVMREHFGGHLADGAAGENILIDVDDDDIVSADALSAGLVFEVGNGDKVHLTDIVVAAPCVEFARFALQLPEDAKTGRRVTEAIRFLHQGMRGYYARFQGSPTDLEVGYRAATP